ncbi:LuxR C-terminal-related transcriptional regulator [Rhodococcus sovatensis]|uniref:LuxR C-terminal-related transcriptional regulator n=1 Tax=Rhodococcus sovatensis TaxID=1805840 RepID=UPI003BB2179C
MSVAVPFRSCRIQSPNPTGQPRRTDPGLSTREVEVLLTWIRSDHKSAVSQALFIAPGTVNTHLSRIRTKYHRAGRPAPTKASLLARAIQDGLIGLDEL